MQRRDQMLNEFDNLAMAELDDMAAKPARAPSRAQVAPESAQPAARRNGPRVWDLLVGLGVLSLIVLAARR